MSKECLPDVLGEKINIIFCGMAAGRESCEMKHYYAKSSNKFWRVLCMVGFTKQQITPSSNCKKRLENYQTLKNTKIGLTDLVKDDCGMDRKIVVKPTDIKRLEGLIKNHKPKIVAFNGKKVAEKYFDKNNVEYGEQKNEQIGSTRIFILPSTSGANGRYWKEYCCHWREVSDLIKK